jgi:leucyl aminopeptidase
MQIEFADSRPDGDFALVIASAGSKRPAVETLGDNAAKVEAALKRQRFDGDSGSVAELFVEETGFRDACWSSAPAAIPAIAEAAEKLGGTAAARLLTSGETHAVIDVEGLGYDADGAARVALAAALRSWRYDRYRTTLKDKQKPTLKKLTVVGGGDGAADRWRNRWQPVFEGVSFTRSLVTEPANVIYPESFVERCRELSKLGIEIEVLDGEQMKKLGMGALLGVAQGSVRDAAPSGAPLERRRAKERPLSPLSARASPSTPAESRSSRPRAWKR